jgi:hypothetical protein
MFVGVTLLALANEIFARTVAGGGRQVVKRQRSGEHRRRDRRRFHDSVGGCQRFSRRLATLRLTAFFMTGAGSLFATLR